MQIKHFFKKGMLIIASIILSLFFIIFFFIGGYLNKNPSKNTTQIQFFKMESGEKKEITQINAEIADTPYKQSLGLMNRKFLGQNNGMLFVFDDDKIREFWMKNTLIPLDIIFLDKNLKIVNILEEVQPCKKIYCETYSSIFPARYVIEVNGGFSKRYNINNNTKIEFKIK